MILIFPKIECDQCGSKISDKTIENLIDLGQLLEEHKDCGKTSKANRVYLNLIKK